MTKQKIYITLAILLTLTFSTQAFAAFTLSSNAITGTTASTIDLGAGNALSLQTTNNGNITTGNGTLTIGSVSTGGQGITIIKGGVLSGGSATNNFLNITGTLPSGQTAQTNGVFVSVNSAGNSAFTQRAMQLNLASGYTGSSATIGLTVNNSAASTGTEGWTQVGNIGIFANDNQITTGSNTGLIGSGSASSTLNIGVVGTSIISTNTPALNVGVGGRAFNATINVGGFFGLMNSAPTLGTSAALIADNGTVAADIFEARDNGTPVVTIADGGTSTFSAPIIASSALNKGTCVLGTSCASITVSSGAICTATDTSAIAATRAVVSSTTLTITGTGTDTIAYTCL